MNLGTERKQFRTDLLIAGTTQEILLGHGVLRKHVQSWDSEKEMVTYSEGDLTRAQGWGKRGLSCSAPAQPRLSKEEQRRFTWTTAEENKKTKVELEAWRKKDRQPFRQATADEEEEGEGTAEAKTKEKNG